MFSEKIIIFLNKGILIKQFLFSLLKNCNLLALLVLKRR